MRAMSLKSSEMACKSIRKKPATMMDFTGQITGIEDEGDERVFEIALRAAVEAGDHATGSAVVSLPRS